MQLKLSFVQLQQPDGVAPVWPALDNEQRSEVLATLARLIAKMAVSPSEAAMAADEVNTDE